MRIWLNQRRGLQWAVGIRGAKIDGIITPNTLHSMRLVRRLARCQGGQFGLPEPGAGAVGTAAVGADQQPDGARVQGLADVFAPGGDGRGTERGLAVVGAQRTNAGGAQAQCAGLWALFSGGVVAPAGRMATVMTALASGIVAGTALGSSLAGQLAETRGPAAAFVVAMAASVALFVLGGIAAMVLRRSQHAAPWNTPRSEHGRSLRAAARYPCAGNQTLSAAAADVVAGRGKQ